MKRNKIVMVVFFSILPLIGVIKPSTVLSDEFWIKTSIEKTRKQCNLLKIEDKTLMCYTGKITYTYPLSIVEIIDIGRKGKNYRIENPTKNQYGKLTTAINNIYNEQAEKAKEIAKARIRRANKIARTNTSNKGSKLTFKQLLELSYETSSKLVSSTFKSCMKTHDEQIPNSDECVYYSLVYKAHVVKRGIEAEIKLDNGDWSSASEIGDLIDSKVAGEMIMK